MNAREKNFGAAGRPRQPDGRAGGKPAKLGLRHALGREGYLFKVDLYLDGKVPPRQRKRILADLRNSIDADAQDSTLEEVLAGLGKPRELAADYAQGSDQPRLLWSTGAAAALCMLMVYWFFLLTYTLGMLAVTIQVGGEFQARFLVVDVTAFSAPDSIGIGWTGDAALWFPVVLALMAFIAASRVWRLVGRRRS